MMSGAPIAQMKTASTRTESLRTPIQQSPVWGPRVERKAHQPGNARAATAAVDTRLRGDKKLMLANADVNGALAEVACQCRARGSRTCTAVDECPCQSKWKTCGVECACHGFCSNSFFHTPRLSIRSGALGEELFTKYELPKHRIAFVVCGPIMSVFEYRRYHEKRLHKSVQHYGVTVSWPGSAQGLPGNPDLDKYVIDPFDDMTGAVNHSCEPNTVFQACWANGKVYAVGRTQRTIMAKEALTSDYKWKGTNNPMEFAEICLCREALCRGFIADMHSNLMELSIVHYQHEIARLQEKHDTTEKALQRRYESVVLAKESGLVDMGELEMELIKNEDENGKLKASIELMIAAVARARASLPMLAPEVDDEAAAEEPQAEEQVLQPIKRSCFSLLKRLGQKFCFLIANLSDAGGQRRRKTEETPSAPSSSVSVSENSSHRTPMPSETSHITTERSQISAAEPPAQNNNTSSAVPLKYQQRATRPYIPRLPLPPRSRYLTDS